ncbi:MAG: selenide, water dikinase SelD [Gammaproteobacteria bacterium]|nr:MAG: selenide, water dikinase SelD [Gammaproteobacteria bacterium]
MNAPIRLTEYSHGAGCGCKISPAVLDVILQSESILPDDAQLLVGNTTRDDAAVYDIGDGKAVISTTDFFTPIVDDPFDFGRIAATNAISDIYAMGGKPLMAIAILGWPVDKLSAELANQVVEGGRQSCKEAGITLAGGHSIDTPEPIFGLAVTGLIDRERVKRNSSASSGNELFLSKPLGIGILTTAQKKGLLKPQHQHLARDVMCELNTIGPALAEIEGVAAMTDVTGFGLLGHLSEVCEGSGVAARVSFAATPVLEAVEEYRQLGCVPGGTQRNFDSYGKKLGPMNQAQQEILCDPQTSGGLLVAVEPDAVDRVLELAEQQGSKLWRIGEIVASNGQALIELDP